jgi:hypothetical protein
VPSNSLNLRHLISMSDSRALFEHADFDKPRKEHGYCVDDVARALLLLERNNSQDPQLRELTQLYFDFISEAQSADGHFANRCNVSGIWTSPAEMGDHWGRALWTLGTVAHRDPDRALAEVALGKFDFSAHHRTHHLRPMIYAGLGAAEILNYQPNHAPAQTLLRDAINAIPRPEDHRWPWPEDRLSYGNAAIPELLMLGGHHLADPKLLSEGIILLKWLIKIETNNGHFSVTPSHGWSRGEFRPSFDQQPIELAALVDACATAFDLTNDPAWLTFIEQGSAWFEGSNDSYTPMYEPMTGAGFDGLTPSGRNENQGAESTLSYLLVVQRRNAYLGVLR